MDLKIKILKLCDLFVDEHHINKQQILRKPDLRGAHSEQIKHTRKKRSIADIMSVAQVHSAAASRLLHTKKLEKDYTVKRPCH